MQEFMAQMDKYISEKGEKTNSKICRPESLYMTCPTLYRSNVKVRNLHTCKSQKEEIQFNKVVDSIRKNITKLPCTKVTYHMGTSGPVGLQRKDSILLRLTMQSPYEIEVNEEYFMHDLIGVIGSIGGTLKLCIGFSIMGLFRDVVASLFQSLVRIIRHKKEKETKIQRKDKFLKIEHLQLKTQNLENTSAQDDVLAPIIAKLTQQEAKLDKRLSDHDSRLLMMEKNLIAQSSLLQNIATNFVKFQTEK